MFLVLLFGYPHLQSNGDQLFSFLNMSTDRFSLSQRRIFFCFVILKVARKKIKIDELLSSRKYIIYGYLLKIKQFFLLARWLIFTRHCTLFLGQVINYWGTTLKYHICVFRVNTLVEHRMCGSASGLPSFFLFLFIKVRESHWTKRTLCTRYFRLEKIFRFRSARTKYKNDKLSC